MYKAIVKFHIPGRPEFVEGGVYHLPKPLAFDLMNRGLVELVEKVEQKPKSKSEERRLALQKEEVTRSNKELQEPEKVSKNLKKS